MRFEVQRYKNDVDSPNILVHFSSTSIKLPKSLVYIKDWRGGTALYQFHLTSTIFKEFWQRDMTFEMLR